MNDKDLSALAVAYQRGDVRAFETLVDALSRTLIAMGYRYTGDWEWARDLTQETWVRVHDRVHQYDPAKSFGSWLYAIHRNRCLDHLRRAWVRLETAPGDEAMVRLSGATPEEDPEGQLERKEFHERLLQALSQLSESQRQVFVRVELEQKDQREVALALGIKFVTLRTTLHFARRRLATALREMEESA